MSTLPSSADADLRRKLTCDHAHAMGELDKPAEAMNVLRTVSRDPQITARQAAECLEYLALIALAQNDVPGGLTYGKQALQSLRDSGRRSPADEAMMLGTLGYAENLNGHSSEAQQLFAEALEAFRRAGRERGPQAMAVRNNWALSSTGAGDPKRALTSVRRDVAHRCAERSGSSPAGLSAGQPSAGTGSIGRYYESRDAFHSVPRRRGEKAPGSPRGILFTWAGVGVAAMGDLKLRRAISAAAAAILEDSVPPTSDAAIALRVTRAQIALDAGRRAEARQDIDAVISLGKSPAQTMSALLIRAELNLADRNVAAAEADARKSLSLAQAAQGGTSTPIAPAWRGSCSAGRLRAR